MITHYWAICYCCSAKYASWDEMHNHMAKQHHSMQNHVGEKYATPCLDLSHKAT